jgi:hypothetical protein
LNYSAIVNSDLKNSVVFLDVPNPNYLSENNLYGIKNTLVANEWFKQLNNFFIFLENKLKKKVIICSHPLTPVDEDYRHQFNSYKISENETMQTIYNSDLVVSVGSTALSYALIYKKPLLLIYNEPIKKSTKFNTLKKLSEELDCKILNIENEDYKNSDWNEIYDFNINKYKNYVNNYLSENFQNKSNSQIISNLVNNNESK